MAYATLSELATYLCVEQASLPTQAQKYLNRAEEMVEQMVWRNYEATDTDHQTAVKNATCAQVESWIEVGDQTAIVSGLKSIAVGEFSMSFADASQTTMICPRARQYLNRWGLLYAGINNSKHTDSEEV